MNSPCLGRRNYVEYPIQLLFYPEPSPNRENQYAKNGQPVSKYSFANGPFQIETVTGQLHKNPFVSK